MYSGSKKYRLLLFLLFALVLLCNGQNKYFPCIEDLGKNKVEFNEELDFCVMLITERYCSGCVTKLSFFLEKKKEQKQSDLPVFILITSPSASIAANRQTLNRIQYLSNNLFPVYFICEPSVFSNELISPLVMINSKGHFFKYDHYKIFRKKSGFLRRNFIKKCI
jgi:hypothetical protein